MFRTILCHDSILFYSISMLLLYYITLPFGSLASERFLR